MVGNKDRLALADYEVNARFFSLYNKKDCDKKPRHGIQIMTAQQIEASTTNLLRIAMVGRALRESV